MRIDEGPIRKGEDDRSSRVLDPPLDWIIS